MSTPVEILEQEANEVSGILCEEVYGYDVGVFTNHIEVVEEQKHEPELPIISRHSKFCKLTLSVEGSDRWNDIIGMGSERIGLGTDSLYTSTGIALLELANVVDYSVSKKDPVNRLRRVAKAFSDDTCTQDICSVLSQQTGVDVKTIVQGLDQDDFAKVSRLRYGLGVSLRAFGIDSEGLESFSSANLYQAINSIENYRDGIANYLSGAVQVGEVDPGSTSNPEITEKVYAVEFPYLKVASCMPMGVGYLLKS